ncbi:MATE family efflux transporter [Salinispira pacifica]|uniref:Multidrug-efflux transporter n=1 Tax=Salinispira pacifica TaxID=1307761 RepID=V5WKK6_9SPIO|nr:MATE family efflux transporter [Salinispira pacifica]AHC15726.1 hypothetical protein L21SP2_2373 [Salinispira pacifica]
MKLSRGQAGEFFRSGGHPVGQVVALGIPLLFGRLTHYLHQIVDSAMLGHFGENSFELAAIGIAGLFTWMLNTFLWPLSNGIQAITARRFGRQDINSLESRHITGEALDNGMVAALVAGTLAISASFLARPVLSGMIETPEILELTIQYISMMRFALIPTGIFFAVQGFFSAINKTSYVMWSGILSNVLNIILNYIFIFGKFGLPAMGIRGAALGTVLAFSFAAVFLIVVVLTRGYRTEYRLFSFRHLSTRLQKDIVRVALPPAVQNIIALGIFMTYQTIIEDYSPLFLAATHAVFSFYRLNKTIIGGFARSAGILAGNALGRGEKQSAGKYIAASGAVAAGIAVLVALFTFLLRYRIAGIFSSDPSTVAVITTALTFFLPFYFMESLGYSFEMVFISNGYGRYVLASEFTTNVLFILGLTLLMRHLFPDTIQLAWLSFGLYQIFHAGIMIAGFLKGRWLDVQVESG